ncbi:MAG: hypothetical protein ACOVOQ_14735 [Flavobacterium sp.]
MEILTPSEEEIIKLGKLLVKELKLEKSVNTLSKWMAHYVAELIKKSEETTSVDEKCVYEKECFEVILKLWNNREHIPNIDKPLNNIKPLIELLDLLKENDYSYPFWRHIRDVPNDATWTGFVEIVKKNSEDIFELCLYASINKKVLEKEEKWLQEYPSMIGEDEARMINHLNNILNRSNSMVYYIDEKEDLINITELSKKERFAAIFENIESKLEEMKTKLLTLKKSVLDESK